MPSFAADALLVLHFTLAAFIVGGLVVQAGHAFNNDTTAQYEAASARMALERTLAFLREHVG